MFNFNLYWFLLNQRQLHLIIQQLIKHMICSHFIQQSNLMFISTCMFGLVYRIIFSQVLCKCQNKKRYKHFLGIYLKLKQNGCFVERVIQAEVLKIQTARKIILVSDQWKPCVMNIQVIRFQYHFVFETFFIFKLKICCNTGDKS